jgi:hypothetical protein
MPTQLKRPVTLSIGCMVIVVLYLWSVINSIARLSNANMLVIVDLFVLLVLLFGVGCVVAIWFGSAWPRWLLIAFTVIPLIANSYLVTMTSEGTSLIQALVGLLSNSWIYWADFGALLLLFSPPSKQWLRETKHVAT